MRAQREAAALQGLTALRVGLSSPSGPCSPGFYCIEGSRTATPWGNTTVTGDTTSSFPVPGNSTPGQFHGDVCPAGHYCPKGSAQPSPCSPGTFLVRSGAESEADCEACYPGFYCPSWAQTSADLLCPPGWFCPAGSVSGHQPGRQCFPGHSCPRGSAEPTVCSPGTFQSSSGQSVCNICPPGFYCMEGSSVPSPCPAGFFSPLAGRTSHRDCSPCTPGSFCNSSALTEPSGPCSPGHFCSLGSTEPSPVSQPYGDVCPTGHFCPQGSRSPKPCPIGSFLPEPAAFSPSHCQPCPTGKYCLSFGLSQPTESDSGWTEVVTVPQADSDRIVTHRPPCLKRPHYACSTYRGDICPRGFYCPIGSAYPQPCEAGSYCNQTGLDTAAGSCAEGYYCPRGSVDPHATPCPAGHYCPFGTPLPLPCPPGTIKSFLGGSTVKTCQLCPPGRYCHQSGRAEPSGHCAEGYYCPEGQTSERPQQHACSAGHYCEKGSVTQTACPPGTYQLRHGQGSCETCPAGFYCQDQGFYCLEGSQNATPMSGVSGGVCPKGHYCAEGSSVPTPCPAGSYRNETGAKGKDDCKPCPLGRFQDLSGQKECNPCPPGYHCQPQSLSPTRGSSTGVSLPLPCPAGYVCPSQSPHSQPVPCPKGTYGPSQGLTTIGECLMCPAGHFCGSEGLVEPSGSCAAGFLCLMGATVPNPTDNKTGSLCPPGTFCQQGQQAVEGAVQPVLCPVGYYCPPGLTLGIEFPCPPGTVQSRRGASSPDACLPCSSGMFCSHPAQSQPTGPCEAGHYCPAGSTRPNSTDYQGNSTGSRICPSGYYCPPGTGNPLPCPAGSLSVSRGLRGVDECPPCPSGLFCERPAISELSDARPCHAGHVCLGGSSSPAPLDGSHGYICPAGNSCPVGSVSEVPCEPGTYSPAPGAAHCIICPRGTMCSSSATQEPSICPAGHFCSAGTVLPEPCPIGTFSNQTGAHSYSVCSPCPSGVYCSSYGASTSQGPCLEGYFCQGGAMAPAPQSSDNFPRNGPCPMGHYCPAGCLSPIPCHPGSIRNTTGGVSMESCTSCPAGYYCSSEGLSNPSGPCAAGFYCPFDFSSTTPYAFLCPKGHYCPEGSPLALPCPTGEYQPNPGSDSCIPCRPGFYCEEAIVGEPWPCPPHSFCPAGTMVPQPCPNGTYTHSNQRGLQEERECLPCPPGKFCRAGRIQGVCAAGYLCVSGSADFTPQGPTYNLTLCQSGMQCAGPCPPGFYCPEGTEEAQLCPANTVRSFSGGASVHDCLPCPPQYWCKAGDPVLYLCPAGHYCDGLPGSDYDGGTGPRPCPLYTYRASAGAGSKGDCLRCPPGSHCNSTALTDFANSPCPPGHWCSGTGPPILCPPGTKRPLPGAAAPSQCEPCAGGTFCPDPRATGTPNVEGVHCRASYQCPVGSVSERPCSAGSYCGPQTAEPRVCPEGYFCPEGSRSYNTPKQLCVFPYYCPANSSAMKSCEGGSMPVNTSGLRASKNSCCSACEGGTYRPYLSLIPQCLSCPPGYFCPPGSAHYKNSTCPVGYVCPVGSTQPVPCPPGSYGNLTQAEKMSDCHPCPAGTFNHLHAQKACFPCGSSSTSPAGSPSCTCIGKNRAFQHSDGSCLCRTGFIFYDELDFKSSTSDSGLDCQPEVNRRCAAGQVRLAASRECVSPSLHSCNIACGPHGGTLDVEMGICQCERYVSAEELCDTACLSTLPQLSTLFSPDGHLMLNFKERSGMIWARTVNSVLGPDIHVRNIKKVHLVQFDSEGVFGWIPTRRDLINQLLSEPIEFLNPGHRTRRDTEGDDDPRGDLAVLPRIPNPIACLSCGDMLIFHLAINHTDRRMTHFPVYQKDHLFNSNPSWDFGAFRRLQILLTQTNFNSTRFAHVFSETGKYVFVDSAVPEWSMVVVVSEEGTECDPRAAVFQPMTPANLVRYGIVKRHRLNLLPDWTVITGVLSLLVVAVVVLTTTVLVLRPSKAKLVYQWKTKPKWRSLGEPFFPVECACNKDSIAVPSMGGILGIRGVGEGAEAEEPSISKGGSASGRCDLEEFNVKTLYDKLEDQNLHIASQLARHRKDTQEFYRNICDQTEKLKNVFENMDHKKLCLLKELLVHNAMRDKNIGEEKNAQAEVTAALLGTVLRECEAQGGYTQPGDANMCYTQFTSMNMTKAEALAHDPVHLQSAAPCLSDHDLSKLVTISPLFKTLHDIQQSLQNLTAAEPSQHLHNAMEHSVPDNHDGQLVPTALDSLSPHHSAVFLFGCHVTQLLANCSLFPSVLLLLAKSIPASSSSCNDALLAHCSGDFYFDAANQILYLSEAKLQHVGHFIAIILQSMAYIASASKRQSFVQALHEAISSVSLQLFSLSFKGSSAEVFKSGGFRGAAWCISEDFLNIRVPTEAQFTEHLLASRLEKYKYFKLEQLVSKLKRSSTENSDTGFAPKGTPMQMSCIEEEIDRMNESFLQLTVQLQKRAQMSTLQKEREESAGNDSARATPTSTTRLNRNGTILLELKRRYVSQRLNELQITLGQMRQCQQHDSKPKDLTGGRTRTDSSTTQQEQKELSYPGVDVGSPADGQWQDRIPANQSHSQQTAESRGLCNYKLESHIPDQQGSDPVQSNNP
ncbi:hypothetical protein Q5P01_010208 [Channa striata]|uniref:TNFR-Cys domain-containing protein n=1 Tax=Channa striata TaxID=64152 RepID=A0AA88SRK2_CHASR|nr:hypothetical protein Q5P01_010208 [Channa striata]